MASNQEKMRGHYGKDPTKEDARHRKSRAGSMEFRFTKLLLDSYITPEARVAEFGCATGYYAEHWQGKCKSYLGIDIVQENVGFFNAKGLANANAQLGDATNCPELADESFDVVLCLGPMYHLTPEGRSLAMAEMARICKPGGVLAFAYINKMGVVYHAMANGWGNKLLPFWKRLRQNCYPNEAGNQAIFAGVNDFNDYFFFTMPEDMEALAATCGLQVVQNAGVDLCMNGRKLEAMGEAQFACYLELAEELLKYPSCTGMANHALMICGKG